MHDDYACDVYAQYTYEEKLNLVKRYYQRYKKEVNLGYISNYIYNKNIGISSLSRKMTGSRKFSEIEFEELLNFYTSYEEIHAYPEEIHDYSKRLKILNFLYQKYRKAVKQKNLIDVVCNNGENLTLQSLNAKMTGKTKFTNFEMNRILSFYNKLERKNKLSEEKILNDLVEKALVLMN